MKTQTCKPKCVANVFGLSKVPTGDWIFSVQMR